MKTFQIKSSETMDELMSTPIARRGPSSRLLRRQSDMLRPDLGRTANLERSIHLLDDALGTPAQTSGKTNMTRLVIDDNENVGLFCLILVEYFQVCCG